MSEAVSTGDGAQAIERLERRLERERKARVQAESLLEEKSRELYLANENLLLVKQDLERQVEQRTQELQMMLGEATSAVNARSRFMAVMSHEIRTPLNGIIGLAELLSLTTLDAEQGQYVEALVKSGAALRQLIDNVLDLSRLEAERLDLERRPFDLLAELESVASVYRPLSAARGLAFGLDLRAEGGRQVVGDSLRLRQILSNL
ncbi:MAG: sensor histidine kinase, partial [Gammaproteobacteria bacterium]